MRAFEYVSANALPELGSEIEGDVRPLAGGTDLLPLMKADVLAPSRLVDLKRVAELNAEIAESADGVTIGALTSLASLDSSAVLRQRYTALAEAAGLAATPQLRNMATLGGNLLQRPRCWYFRSPHFACWLKGGEECFAREGENQLHAIIDVSPCVAVHPSDPPAALLALDAEVEVWSAGGAAPGTRHVPLDEFFTAPTDERRAENVLQAGEIVTAVRLPSRSGVRSTYRKAMNRKVWAFALVGVAAALRFDAAGRVADARVVLNGVAPVPWRARAAEQVLVGASAGLSDTTVERAAQAAVEAAQPLAQNGYKVPLAQGLVRQALRSLRETP
jgi:xanthine dehydrogenase YagS FAD-binding subunit